MKRILKLRTEVIPIKELDLRKEKMRLRRRTKEKVLRGKQGWKSKPFVLSIQLLLWPSLGLYRRENESGEQSAGGIWFQSPPYRIFPPSSNPSLTQTGAKAQVVLLHSPRGHCPRPGTRRTSASSPPRPPRSSAHAREPYSPRMLGHPGWFFSS